MDYTVILSAFGKSQTVCEMFGEKRRRLVYLLIVWGLVFVLDWSGIVLVWFGLGFLFGLFLFFSVRCLVSAVQ